MSSRPPSPPWIPEALLWLLTRRDDWRATVIGDLREEFAGRASRGRIRATLWYWSETLRLVTSGVRRLGVRQSGPVLRTRRVPVGTLAREAATDGRLALRMMRRQPALTAVVVLTLALGIGATAVIFNLLDTLVLRVVDLPGHDRLVMLSEQRPSSAPEDRAAAPANFLDWRSAAAAFSFVGAFDTGNVNLADAAGEARPERLVVTAASAGVLESMGARAQLGRLIEPADDAWGAPPVVVLSDTLWRIRFAANPAVIGRSLLLDDRPHAIVGVTPPSFAFPRETAAWTPLALSPQAAADRVTRSLSVVARLGDGVTLGAARAEADAIAARLQASLPETNRSVGIAVTPLAVAIRDEAAPTMIAAWQTAALFVLLIACVNVAQLLLARGRDRRREFMVRVSLGAGLGRLARQLLIEGLGLAAAAWVVALGIGWLALRAIKAALPPELTRLVPGWELIGLDARLILFTSVVAAVAAALFSVLPVFQAARVDLADGLKQGGRGQAGDGGEWHRGLLTAAEIAGALVLAVGTALAVRGASDLLHGDAGFDQTGVVVASVTLPAASYDAVETRRTFHARATARLGDVPGVTGPALVNVAPSALRNASRPVFVDAAAPDSSDVPRADYRVITPSYFDTLRIPILAGRALLETDRHDARPVAVVSLSMAARFWPDTDPIGQRFRQQRDGEWVTVVGVAGDVVHHWFNRRRHPTFYRPFAQDPQLSATIVARVEGEPLSAAPGLQDAIAGIDPRLPLHDVSTLSRMREVGLTGLTFLVRIMTVLCALAVALAAVGIYAAVSHGVTTRRREIGLRVALGARPGRIVRDVARRVAIVTLAGLIVGGGGALVVGKVMASMMFGLIALDAGIYAAVAAGLATVALAAGLLPARAALAVDPATTLRAD